MQFEVNNQFKTFTACQKLNSKGNLQKVAFIFVLYICKCICFKGHRDGFLKDYFFFLNSVILNKDINILKTEQLLYN